MKSQSLNRRPTRAFTLVEVLGAAFVMALAIGSCIIALQAGIKNIDYARHLTLASQVLQSQAESVRLLSWTQIQALPSTATVVNIDSVFAANKGDANDFTLTMQSLPVTDRETTMREITLNVTWTSTFGTTHSRSFVSRYSKDGLHDYYYTLSGS
ncbi:MAG: hypothetical protein WC205_11290 [Opitutaceae bacterium]